MNNDKIKPLNSARFKRGSNAEAFLLNLVTFNDAVKT